MHEYWHVILHSLLDTIKIVPFLFIIYYLIELIEYRYALKFRNNKFLKGKFSPIFGSLLGCVPQCGFSVVSTDLFSRGTISIGALIAVYIATSDEAIPLMIANPSSLVWVLLLIGVKLVLGIGIGYLSLLLFKLIFKNDKNIIKDKQKVEGKKEEHNHEHNHDHHEHEHEHLHTEKEEIEDLESDDGVIHDGCCKHSVDAKSFQWMHPMLHCLKISAFILVINIIFGFITDIWIGQDNLVLFLNNSIYIQPLIAILIGLIPNCASSVVLSEMFIMGGLSFGALVAGLCINSGLGLVFLLRQNKNKKVNLFIILTLLISSLVVGYLFNFLFI